MEAIFISPLSHRTHLFSQYIISVLWRGYLMFFSCLELQLQPWLVSHDCCDDPSTHCLSSICAFFTEGISPAAACWSVLCFSYCNRRKTATFAFLPRAFIFCLRASFCDFHKKLSHKIFSKLIRQICPLSVSWVSSLQSTLEKSWIWRKNVSIWEQEREGNAWLRSS